jgi:hypothetical protein
MRARRIVRGLAVALVLAAVLVLSLTSCPSNRDGMPGQLSTAKEETQSAARSAALALELWGQHRSTRSLTSVQLGDARDEMVKAYQDVASLTVESSADLRRQTLLVQTMAGLIETLNDAGAAVRGVSPQSDPISLGQHLSDGADTLERDYR